MLARCKLNLTDLDTGEVLGSSQLERPIEFADLDAWMLNWRLCAKRGFMKGHNLSLSVEFCHYEAPKQTEIF